MSRAPTHSRLLFLTNLSTCIHTYLSPCVRSPQWSSTSMAKQDIPVNYKASNCCIQNVTKSQIENNLTTNNKGIIYFKKSITICTITVRYNTKKNNNFDKTHVFKAYFWKLVPYLK